MHTAHRMALTKPDSRQPVPRDVRVRVQVSKLARDKLPWRQLGQGLVGKVAAPALDSNAQAIHRVWAVVGHHRKVGLVNGLCGLGAAAGVCVGGGGGVWASEGAEGAGAMKAANDTALGSACPPPQFRGLHPPHL